MYKFLASFQYPAGALAQVLPRALAIQKQAQAEAGCLACDLLTCLNDPDRLVFYECFASQEAHAWHCAQDYTKDFIAFHERLYSSFSFEPIAG